MSFAGSAMKFEPRQQLHNCCLALLGRVTLIKTLAVFTEIVIKPTQLILMSSITFQGKYDLNSVKVRKTGGGGEAT
jgi:hypothetical protein